MRAAPITLLRLIERSPDRGDGWRSVSDTLWPYISEQCAKFPTLVEIEHGDPGRVRLTTEAENVLRWS
jgi:hypothetical protein